MVIDFAVRNNCDIFPSSSPERTLGTWAIPEVCVSHINLANDLHQRNKVYMTDSFFYLLDQIFMLLSFENRKKKVLINFSSQRLRRIEVSNFTSGWVQYRERRETGDGRAVTSAQEC